MLALLGVHSGEWHWQWWGGECEWDREHDGKEEWAQDHLDLEYDPEAFVQPLSWSLAGESARVLSCTSVTPSAHGFILLSGVDVSMVWQGFLGG